MELTCHNFFCICDVIALIFTYIATSMLVYFSLSVQPLSSNLGLHPFSFKLEEMVVESGLIKKECSEETGPDLLVVFGIGRDHEDPGARVVRNGDAVDVDAADGPSEDVDRVGRVDVLPLRRDQQREQATKFLRSQNKAFLDNLTFLNLFFYISHPRT